MNIEKILNKIKLLFKEHYIYEKSELIRRITSMKSYSLEQINTALDILINDKNEFLTDMLGRNGRLVNIDKYYMFQPIEIEENKKLTLYQMKHPINYNREHLFISSKNLIKKKTTHIEKKSKYLEFYNFYENYTILLEKNTKNKKNWIESAGNTIDNLSKYNDIPREILIVLAVEHIFELYGTVEKIKLLNEIEKIKVNLDEIDKDILPEYNPEFLILFQQIIDKYLLQHDGIKIIALVDYNKEIWRGGYGFIKLNTDMTPSQWTTDVSGLNTKFVELMDERFKINIDKINNFIGFLTNSKSKIVFKVKSIASSEHKRINKGQQLPTSGENRSVTVRRLNNVLSILNPEKVKYIMDDTNSNIDKVYDESFDNSINDMELAVELELILRYLELNQLNNRKWFFSTLEDKLNDVENIKVE